MPQGQQSCNPDLSGPNEALARRRRAAVLRSLLLYVCFYTMHAFTRTALPCVSFTSVFVFFVSRGATSVRLCVSVNVRWLFVLVEVLLTQVARTAIEFVTLRGSVACPVNRSLW